MSVVCRTKSELQHRGLLKREGVGKGVMGPAPDFEILALYKSLSVKLLPGGSQLSQIGNAETPEAGKINIWKTPKTHFWLSLSPRHTRRFAD